MRNSVLSVFPVPLPTQRTSMDLQVPLETPAAPTVPSPTASVLLRMGANSKALALPPPSGLPSLLKASPPLCPSASDVLPSNIMGDVPTELQYHLLGGTCLDCQPEHPLPHHSPLGPSYISSGLSGTRAGAGSDCRWQPRSASLALFDRLTICFMHFSALDVIGHC